MTKIMERRNGDSAGDPPWVEGNVSAFELLAVHVDLLAGRAAPSILLSFLPFVETLELRALVRGLTYVEMEHSESICSSVFYSWVARRRLTVLDLAMIFECRHSLPAFARICGTM
jgi:hypothetical protein